MSVYLAILHKISFQKSKKHSTHTICMYDNQGRNNGTTKNRAINKLNRVERIIVQAN